MKFSIIRSDTLLNTPGLLLAVRGWHELLENDLADPGVGMVAWDHKAIRCVADGLATVGVLSWIKQDWSNQAVVCIAYVLPEYRRKGVHTLMWADLVSQARELRLPVIASGYHIGNDASRNMQRKRGSWEVAIGTRFMVLPE